MSYSSGAYQTSEQRRYLDGECHETAGGSPAQTYWHGDLIASTFATSDSAGDLADTMAYTAFGERVNLGDGSPPASFPRYEYAGGFGYESGMVSLSGVNTNLPTMTLQHLGARWYDPSLGRFMQRDPMGLIGGANVYLYCRAAPASHVDGSGLYSTILTPQGLAAWIEAELQLGKIISINVGGRLVPIVSTAVVPVAGSGRQTIVIKTAESCLQFTFERARVIIDPTSKGAVLSAPQQGVCGVTGIEAAPAILALWLLKRRYRNIAQAPRSVEAD